MPATKLVFEFLILTTTRSGEARGALWEEFDPIPSYNHTLWLANFRPGQN